MKRNEKFVIAINRELGSGGPLIKTLEERYSLSVEEIEKLKGQSHNWLAELKRALFASEGIAVTSNYILAVPGDKPVQPTTYDMFMAEQEILKSIAEDESCVIAGRSGFYVFRDHPNHLSVLIQASMPFRIERVMRKQNMTREQAVKTIEQIDKMRENYIKEFTKTSRYDTRNYDLVITADGKTEDQIVDIIMKYIE